METLRAVAGVSRGIVTTRCADGKRSASVNGGIAAINARRKEGTAQPLARSTSRRDLRPTRCQSWRWGAGHWRA
eukprot:3878358-Rhodomonas_salina.1